MSGDPVTVKAECYYVRSAASSLKKSGEILLEECHILKHNVSVVQNCFDGANYERLKVNVTIAEKQIRDACEKIRRACEFLKKVDDVVFEYLYDTRYTG